MAAYTRDEALEFIDENDVKFIRLAFCDVFGNHKNISIMPSELSTAFDQGVNFDSFLILGYNDPVYQDLFLKPDPATLSILPWRPSTGCVVRFYCDVFCADGTPFPYDFRKFLRDTIAQCRQKHFQVRVGLKSEFYLFLNDENGNPTEIPFDNGGYFDVAPLDRGENIRREICLNLEEMGIIPESSHHESGPGQNEIDFRASDALRTADNFITYKNVVSNIAMQNGVSASFKAKPLPEESGNGLHLKVGLYRAGENLFESDQPFVSKFMAGVLHRMRDITLFLNTQRDSYARFGQKEAPKYITWSSQNRSRLLRVPEIGGRRTGFILRSPDSAINPYLAFAMVIRAGLSGVRGNEELPPATEVNGRDRSNDDSSSYEMLPLSLDEAISCARESMFLHEDPALGAIADRYISVIETVERS